MGKTLYNHDFWGIEWKFCAIPICGFVIAGHNNRKFYRMRSFLMTLGGPIANCLLILAAVILLFHISSPRLSAVIKPFIAANIFSLLLGLWPRKVNFTGRSTPSDGLTLLMTPFMSKLKINHEIESCYVWEGYCYFRKNRFEDAKRIYETGLALFPNSTAIQNEMGQVLLHQGKYVEARNLFIELQKRVKPDSAMSINILYSIATADVRIGGNELLEEADAFSKTACEKMPWQTAFKWTRGLVLVKKGNTEQGLTLLKEVTDKMEDSSAKAAYVSYIAEVENKNGE
jgi:tetratricopeptide (TPR) repeat protein